MDDQYMASRISMDFCHLLWHWMIAKHLNLQLDVKKNGESNLELLDGQCQSWASHWCRSVLLWIVGSIVAWMITCFARENVVWKHIPCRPLSHEPAYLAGLNHIQPSLRILNEGIFTTMTHRCSYESWPFAKWLKLQIQYAGIVHGTFLKVARTTGETFRAPG